ncbi:PREDICTED: digestive cysteine proteinase 1 [Dinoponera quadriceps]|uniref:Digestive cysteine proteinase 1 n=1 Tax=Dinoponera quadriceps TaxID=609295 RepID=A0A6P3Y0L7_DINQU|nr:PREDICTED: digestive cysteine proteinase 1 [Dinoponera quadriceps]XP_014483758.1 PREDICTED: digestive cysteine proteinase 1 [Dinoponera quadriceps]XP_014483767.1 PREDICTED: digestive cysteine proteinase 1 [Dinoponera quadriceps]XP_014483776.1 PREDICTED: digestive cysteine proteinase 1 [Dinoponera quadriceps]XP_014483784.1 PREDICTED: digestive cysteine proteinase 1 [Dinoponera quadriceps]
MKMFYFRRTLLLIFCGICYVVASSKEALAGPAFSQTYTVKGTLYIPYAEIREPFYAWYDGTSGSSRIDYYGGMVKTYQLSHKEQYGASIKIAPVTTESVINEDTCLQVNGTKDMKIEPQSILPDTHEMKCIGEEMINGLMCEKWRLVQEIGEKTNKYTLWIRYKKSPRVPQLKEPIPVRYEMRGFNSLLGSHYDHYYLDYDWYSSETPSSDVFKITENTTCASFPGPGENHIYTFNPMREFIHNYEGHVDEAFDNFKTTHKKHYSNDLDHKSRKEVFRQNMRFIHSTNRANLGYQLNANHLADRTDLEMRALRGKQYTKGYKGGAPFPHDIEKEIADVPDSVNWGLYGAVTPVKDQSVCGSCWSFGTTGAVEGAYFMKYNKLISLSQQALIDCSWGFGNNGCDGGEDFRAYQWIMKHGLPTEEDYGDYLGQDGYCHINNVTTTAKITGYVNVTPSSVDALKIAIALHGPISVAIDASHKTFSFYSHGVYYDAACGNTEDKLDHAVLAIGYGTLLGKNYWLVKNSWSNYWGNDGYILMAQKDDNCGILLTPTYVTM